MGIEDFTSVESSEWWENQASEGVSEAYKESSKKASAWIKRTKKDERRAKRYDFLLAKFLVEMILKKKYDTVLEDLFSCMDAGYGTNFLLGVLSLIYLPISHEIRKFSGNEKVIFEYEVTPEKMIFDDHHMPPQVRDRVNQWIQDMEIVISLEASALITQRTLGLILYDEKIRVFTGHVFSFFFTELNISISQQKAQNYSEFILTELEKSLKKNMPELRKKWTEEGLKI